ncbi:MAG: single-stranded DNA-binding protein [Gemmataceae bacterium]
MANLNKVMLIGRLTRDPEPIEVRGAVSGAKFGFAVNNRKQNTQTQQWEDVPVFIDMEIWNRGENSRQADRVLQTLRKGQQVFIEGHLKMDTWDDKNGGGKRSALRVVVENFQYLEPRTDGEMPAPRAARPAMAPRPAPAPARNGGYNGSYDEESDMGSAPGRPGVGGNEDDIPF